MATSQAIFDKRLRRIVRSHYKMRNGVRVKVMADGLIVARPRRRAPSIPLNGLLTMVGAFFLFKAFLLVNIGPITYGNRVESLASGTLIEQGGAWVMQADPLSIWLATQISALIH